MNNAFQLGVPNNRHYAELILRLQGEMRSELRRLDKERKDQEELVENLRDKIASLTVSTPAFPLISSRLKSPHLGGSSDFSKLWCASGVLESALVYCLGPDAHTQSSVQLDYMEGIVVASEAA